MMTFGSLFAGIAGFDEGFRRAGMRCLWNVEKESDCRAVLRRHDPEAKQFDDVMTVGGHNLEPVDVLCGGSPCQPFSLAGLRAGLADARGNLLFEFCRIADELDPDIIVWENVPGVLSSKDNAFGCLLAALVGESAAVEPTGGRWTNAGVVAGQKRVAAWRVLDAQYFGVAQRRRRVFVVASAGALCPAEILFEPESVPRHSPPRREKGQGVADRVAGCLNSGGNNGGFRSEPGEHIISVDLQNTRLGGDLAGTVDTTRPSRGGGQAVMAVLRTDNQGSNGWGVLEDGTTHALGGAQDAVLAFDTTQITSAGNYSQPKAGEPCHPLAAGAHPPAIVFDWQSGGECRLNISDEHTSALQVKQTPAVLLRNREGCDGGGKGPLISEEQSLTLATANDQILFQPEQPAVAFCERGRDEGRTLEVQEELSYCLTNPASGGRTHARQIAGAFGVRRLLPVECERLQGFSDRHTEYGIDEQGNRVEMSDSARYRQLGNAVCVNVSAWIGRRIVAVMKKEKAA